MTAKLTYFAAQRLGVSDIEEERAKRLAETKPKTQLEKRMDDLAKAILQSRKGKKS
jgi:hypothetical protein